MPTKRQPSERGPPRDPPWPSDEEAAAPDPDVVHHQGVELARSGRLEQALVYYDRVVALRPDCPEAWNSRGVVLAKLKRHGEALASFDRALSVRPNYAEALANRGDVFGSLGRAQEALGNYGRCLALKPDHVRTLNRRGMVLSGLGRCREALDHHNLAISLLPDDPEAHNGRGLALSRLGRHAAALASFARAISLKPDYAEALRNNADALAAMGRSEESLDNYDRALAINPTDIDALRGRGLALAELGRLEAALDVYDQALTAKPALPQALIGKGKVLHRLKRYEEALNCYDLALETSPELSEARTRRADVLNILNRLSHAEAHYFRAEALRAIERFSEAVETCDKAIKLYPDYHEVWNARGLALAGLGELTDALDSYDRALALRNDSVEVYINRSAVLRTLGRLEEALAGANCALALAPGNASALNNRGNVLRDLGCIAEALNTYDQAVAADPRMAQSHFNRAVCLLLSGDFERGWEEYEWRWQLPEFESGMPQLFLPLWLGEEDVAGSTILVHAEQGHGDTLQFARYVPLLAEKGATVVFAVQPLLRPLLAGLSGAHHILDRIEDLPPADFRCPLLSLPLAFGARLESIPAAAPYVAPPSARLREWRDNLGARRGPRVGLAWSGNPRHKSDRDRSLTLQQLQPIAELGLPLYCLQREMRPGDLPEFAMFRNIHYFGDALRDFADTAALIACLDLVITVDTAVAHLAGAMGKPVWVLLSQAPDWRWMLGRSDSPWYPTMRLFRQTQPGDWAPVIDRVRTELIKVIR
jgi:tetratricopeptide (TPR) repeat protein